MSVTINGTSGITSPAVNTSAGTANFDSLSASNNVLSAVNSLGFRNRIINGDMRIDQRNGGAAYGTSTGSSFYSLDRWNTEYSQVSKYIIQQNGGAVTPPTGYSNYLGVTSAAAYSSLSTDYFHLLQRVEGFNVADLGWGAAGAQTVTLSFLVRSSISGTHSGALRNAAGTRSYPYSFQISSANTWEFKTVVIPGDTAGTWAKDNSTGIQLSFNLGSGSNYLGTAGAWAAGNYVGTTGSVSIVSTNSATFYITGVQLEAGTVATPFERRDYGRELIMCQRYYWQNTSGVIIDGFIRVGSDTSRFASITNPVPMRAAPTATVTWDGGSSPNIQGQTPFGFRATVFQGDTTISRIITAVTASSEL